VSGVLCFAAAKFDCFNGNCSLKVVMMFLGRVVSPRFMLSSFQLGYNKCLKVYNIIQRKIYRCHDNKKQVTFRINTKLIEKIDRYIDKMNNEGLSIKKIDLVETAIYKYMKELTDEKK
jgi:hypothetical protein